MPTPVQTPPSIGINGPVALPLGPVISAGDEFTPFYIEIIPREFIDPIADKLAIPIRGAIQFIDGLFIPASEESFEVSETIFPGQNDKMAVGGQQECLTYQMEVDVIRESPFPNTRATIFFVGPLRGIRLRTDIEERPIEILAPEQSACPGPLVWIRSGNQGSSAIDVRVGTITPLGEETNKDRVVLGPAVATEGVESNPIVTRNNDQNNRRNTVAIPPSLQNQIDEIPPATTDPTDTSTKEDIDDCCEQILSAISRLADLLNPDIFESVNINENGTEVELGERFIFNKFVDGVPAMLGLIALSLNNVHARLNQELDVGIPDEWLTTKNGFGPVFILQVREEGKQSDGEGKMRTYQLPDFQGDRNGPFPTWRRGDWLAEAYLDTGRRVKIFGESAGVAESICRQLASQCAGYDAQKVYVTQYSNRGIKQLLLTPVKGMFFANGRQTGVFPDEVYRY